MFWAITQRLLTNRRHPISFPISALYNPTFFEQDKARGSAAIAEPPAQSNGKSPYTKDKLWRGYKAFVTHPGCATPLRTSERGRG